ncbi:MAG: alpha/beta hydrolase [Nocardioidaceae bacterium]
MPSPFEYTRVDADGVWLNVAVAGSGPPVLLLHGYPQTHLIWRHVAPALLAAGHTVVLTDLRGYGDSDKPAPDPEDLAYSKRAMARDQLLVMRQLGFERFALVGHDRGARVAHRLALDTPEAVTRLALLDIVPTRHVLTHVDRAMATAYYHWFFLTVGGGVPETLIGHDPAYWVRSFVEPLVGGGTTMADEAMREYVRCFSDPASIAGSCADYRAGASVDLVHDEASAQAGEQLSVPTLVVWGAQSFVGRHYDPAAVWADYATDLRTAAVASGHFVPEEAPDELVAHLTPFLHR